MNPARTKALRLATAGIGVTLLLTQPTGARASTIPMPAGSRSWILVSSGDCDDDGPNVNNDRGHCAGAVSRLNPSGNIGHGQIQTPYGYEIFVDAAIEPEAFRGFIQTTAAYDAFLDMAMIDTYTLNGSTLPAGTVVSITVTFHAVGTMHPAPILPGLYGSGVFAINLGSSFNPNPIVIPENTRVQGTFPNGSAQTPFDLAFYLAARPKFSTIDFSHTATIGFTLPDGTSITSTGGYGEVVPVQPETWSGVKARFHR